MSRRDKQGLAKFPLVTDDEGTKQVKLERLIERATAAKQLSKQLIAAVEADDATTFRRVAETIELLREKPFKKSDRFKPFEPLDFVLLSYFRSHPTGTIDQLLSWCTDHLEGWQKARSYNGTVQDTDERRARDKMVRRRCRVLELGITPSAPGPKAKTSR